MAICFRSTYAVRVPVRTTWRKTSYATVDFPTAVAPPREPEQRHRRRLRPHGTSWAGCGGPRPARAFPDQAGRLLDRQAGGVEGQVGVGRAVLGRGLGHRVLHQVRLPPAAQEAPAQLLRRGPQPAHRERDVGQDGGVFAYLVRCVHEAGQHQALRALRPEAVPEGGQVAGAKAVGVLARLGVDEADLVGVHERRPDALPAELRADLPPGRRLPDARRARQPEHSVHPRDGNGTSVMDTNAFPAGEPRADGRAYLGWELP
ncbi:hypothetical protein GCM10020001_108790 [Nonomuraea salmonea]